MAPSVSCTTDLHEDRHTPEKTSKRKIHIFTAGVFVISTASVASLLLYIGQSAFASSLAGFFVGATAAIEVGWFGGRVFFGEDS